MIQKIGDKFYEEVDTKVISDNANLKLAQFRRQKEMAQRQLDNATAQLDELVNQLSLIQGVGKADVTIDGNKIPADIQADIQAADVQSVKEIKI
jgi:hypothetical protein